MVSNMTDPELLARLTNEVIPLDSSNSIQVKEIKEDLTWQHNTISYTSLWADGAAIPLVLRAYLSPLTYWQTQDDHKRDREWAVLRKLRLDGFPGPRPLAQGDSEAGQFIIWRQPFGEGWHQEGEEFGTEAKSLIPQLAELLSRLHALNHNSLNNEPLYQATVAGTLVRMLLWSREMANEDLRQVVARLKPAVAQVKSWSPRLIHGNLTLENILTHDGKITALINWENSAIGDPRWDVMTAAHWVRNYDAELADQLVNWYETFTGNFIADRTFWWALVSVRLWALKAWTAHATQTGTLPSRFARWTQNLDQIKERAFADLQSAGL